MDRRPVLALAATLAGLPVATLVFSGGAGAWCGTNPTPTWDPSPTVTNPPVPPSTGRTPGTTGTGPSTTSFTPPTTFRPGPTGDPGATGGPTGPRRPRASALDWRRWWNAERVRLWPHRGGSGSKIAATGGGNGAGPGRCPWESALPAALGGDPAISDRRAAAFAGAYVRDPALLPLMTRLAADPSDDVRDVAVLGMAMCGTGHGETFTVLAAILEDDGGDVHRRSGSAVALGHLGDPAAVPILARVLARRDLPVQVRGGAALALGLLGDRAACADLANALRDGRQEDCVRGFAAAGLSLLAHPARARGDAPAGSDPAGTLREIAGDPKSAHAPVRQTALLALGRCPPSTENIEKLTAALKNEPDPCSRACAALALGSLGNGDAAAARAARDALLESFQREAPELRAFAALGLGMGKHVEARKTLEKHLAEPGDPEPRAACAVALGLLGDPAATAALLGVVQAEKSPALRTAATEALGLLGGREAADALRQLAAEPAAEVRGQALYGLGLAGDSADLGRLAGALGEATALVRQGAVLGLSARGGPPSRDFLLSHAARESDPGIRSLAIRGAALADSVAPNPVIARSPRVSPWLPLPE